MGEKHSIRVTKKHERAFIEITSESCMLCQTIDSYSFCELDTEMECNYGLTEINVPMKCPLRNGMVEITIDLKEAVVDIKSPDSIQFQSDNWPDVHRFIYSKDGSFDYKTNVAKHSNTISLNGLLTLTMLSGIIIRVETGEWIYKDYNGFISKHSKEADDGS